jgi:hypothetical protein
MSGPGALGYKRAIVSSATSATADSSVVTTSIVSMIARHEGEALSDRSSGRRRHR